MSLLRPLLLDNVPSIQQSAALALGRLANYSDELAEAVVQNEILPQLVYSLSQQNVTINSNLITVAFLQESSVVCPPCRRQALSPPRQVSSQLRRARRTRRLPLIIRPQRQRRGRLLSCLYRQVPQYFNPRHTDELA